MNILPIAPLELDIKGTNPDNYIENEVRQYNNSIPISLIKLNRGLYFADTLSISLNGVPLERYTHYEPVDMHHVYTLKCGREVYDTILIYSSGLSGVLTVSYQALGGEDSYNRDNLISNLEEVEQLSTVVDWSKISNKQPQFDPEDHLHIIQDIYDFSVVDRELDKIKLAILEDSKSKLYQLLDERLRDPNFISCKSIRHDNPTYEYMSYDAVLYYLSRNRLLSPVWIDTDSCHWQQGTIEKFYIDTTHLNMGDTVYWELYTYDPDIDLSLYFPTLSGSITATKETQEITYTMRDLSGPIEEFYFYVGVKLTPDQEDFDAVSFRLTIILEDLTIYTDHILPNLVYGTNHRQRDLPYSDKDEGDKITRLLHLLRY